MVSVKFPVLPGVFDEARVVEIVSCVAGVVSAAVVSCMSASIFPLYTPVFKIIQNKQSKYSLSYNYIS